VRRHAARIDIEAFDHQYPAIVGHPCSRHGHDVQPRPHAHAIELVEAEIGVSTLLQKPGSTTFWSCLATKSLSQRSVYRYYPRVDNSSKKYLVGAVARFVDDLAAGGRVFFTLEDLLSKTGLSPVAAKNQLLRFGNHVVRVTPRQQHFLIVSPEHRAFGAPPVDWWLDDYMQQLGHPYYVALLSAAATFGSSQQAIQQTQVITDLPRRDLIIGRIHVKFFMKSGINKTLTEQAPNAYAPLMISTLESTIFDLIRYAHSLGGIERMAETIGPMIRGVKPSAFRRVLDAEQEVPTVQRLGFVLERIGAEKLASVAHAWLPSRLQPVLLSVQHGNEQAASPDQKWKVINNAKAFA